MKKLRIKSLSLNKKVVSKFNATKVKGGFITGKTGCIDQCDIK
ncbi:hypothetical protein [uncultured Kordia sp.]|nr:hypothetical protein [uncultured Kordia sp.]